MQWIKRIFLFAIVNILVMTTITIALGVLAAMGFPVGAGGGMAGLIIWSLVWGMGGALISLLMSRQMAKWMMGVEVIDPDTADARLSSLVSTVHRLARDAGLPAMPQVGIYDSPEVNAFATGPSKSRSLVAVSSGLLQRFGQADVEAILGHEVSHIANGDMVTMTLIQGVVNAFVIFFSRIIAFFVGSQVESKNRYWVEFATVIVCQILFGLLGSMVVNYFSRRREFRADAGSASLLGAGRMIHALESLGATRELIDTSQPAVATLKINEPPKWLAVFSTHPPLEARIEALKNLS